MLNALYSKDVLRQAAKISRTERLPSPGITVTRRAPTCGSRIVIDLSADDGGRVLDYAQDIHACALGQAAASIVAQHVVGKRAADLIPVARQVRAMLLDGAGPPGGEWADFEVLAPVHNYAPRHGAVMLALEATLDALGQLTGDPGLPADQQLTRSA